MRTTFPKTTIATIRLGRGSTWDVRSDRTPDARDLDEGRQEVRDEVRRVFRDRPSVQTVDVYAPANRGGYLIDSYRRSDVFRGAKD